MRDARRQYLVFVVHTYDVPDIFWSEHVRLELSFAEIMLLPGAHMSGFILPSADGPILEKYDV